MNWHHNFFYFQTPCALGAGFFTSNGVISALTLTTPVEGIGGYGAVAGAILFDRSTLPALVTS